MKKSIVGVLSIIAVLILIGSTVFVDKKKEEKESIIQWLTFEEAVEKSKVSPRKIFIDVYTDWCGWCKVMDKNTFNEKTIATYLNENYYPVKFNAEQKEDIVFDNTTFKFVPNGRRGYHQLAASLLNNKLSYPTVVFLNEEFKIIQVIAGYKKPKQFDEIIKYIGEGYYTNTKWEKFQKEYISPF